LKDALDLLSELPYDEIIPTLTRLDEEYGKTKHKKFQIHFENSSVFVNGEEIINAKSTRKFQIFSMLFDQFIDDYKAGIPATKFTAVSVNRISALLEASGFVKLDPEKHVRWHINKIQNLLRAKFEAEIVAGIDQKIVNSVRYYARKLKANIRFETEEICDLEQELMLFVCTKMNRFNDQKSQVGTFVSQILKNHTANLIREKYAKKSCDSGVFCDVDWQDFESENCAEDIVNAAYINAFVKRHLPKYLQNTFETLKYNDVKTTARLLGKSRSAIYTHIAKIRVLMADFRKERSNEN
jgi:DNA-directed RNA polymerase specialized sigma24 family protein